MASQALLKMGDLLLAALVIAITALLLVPLPTWLLDILLSINLCISLLLLLVGLYTTNALTLLSFPSTLLLTTLYRLSLNVASARLILTQGDAGRVIETFGTFLIRGEIVVGIIIFVIITIVNYIVISRGASRVSEVAARFALDSLPGKQMAIDSDLRAGMISREEAERRRDDLRKESQLYGSMDGAMKFVQGDAIAGFFIILTNIIGGLYMGVSAGMSFSDAAHTYTVLTVGDGLVSQIPALLISICAGVVVTRVSSGENRTLGYDLAVQLFNKPAIVIFSGLLLLTVGLMPGLPHAAFIAVGLLFVAAGSMLRRPVTVAAAGVSAPLLEFRPVALGLTSEQVEGGSDLSAQSVVQLNLDANLLQRVFEAEAAEHLEHWRRLRMDFFEHTGVRLPDLKVSADDRLAPCSFSLSYKNLPFRRGKVPLDHCLVEMHPESAALFGLQLGLEEIHPLTGQRVFWALQNAALKRVLDAAGIRSFNFFEYIGLCASRFFLDSPQELIGLSDAHELLKELDARSPGLLSEGLGQNFIPIPRLAEVLQRLVRSGVSLRDPALIIDAISNYCATKRVTISDQENLDLPELCSFVRQACRRQLLARVLGEDDRLKVITLAPAVEEYLRDSDLEQGLTPALALDPRRAADLRSALRQAAETLLARGTRAFAILTSAELRDKVQVFTQGTLLYIPVVSFSELEADVVVENVACWNAQVSTGV